MRLYKRNDVLRGVVGIFEAVLVLVVVDLCLTSVSLETGEPISSPTSPASTSEQASLSLRIIE